MPRPSRKQDKRKRRRTSYGIPPPPSESGATTSGTETTGELEDPEIMDQDHLPETQPGPSGLQERQHEPQPGPSGLQESQPEPQPGPSGIQERLPEPLPGPSGIQRQAEPQPGPSGIQRQVEPQPGPSGIQQSQPEPQPGPSGIQQRPGPMGVQGRERHEPNPLMFRFMQDIGRNPAANINAIANYGLEVEPDAESTSDNVPVQSSSEREVMLQFYSADVRRNEYGMVIDSAESSSSNSSHDNEPAPAGSARIEPEDLFPDFEDFEPGSIADDDESIGNDEFMQDFDPSIEHESDSGDSMPPPVYFTSDEEDDPEYNPLVNTDIEPDRDWMTADECLVEMLRIMDSHPSTPKIAGEKFGKLIKAYGERGINRRLDANIAVRRDVSHIKTGYRKVQKFVPTIKMNFTLRDHEAENQDDDDEEGEGREVTMEIRGYKEYPRKQFNPSRYEVLKCLTYVSVKKTIQFMRKNHPLPPGPIQVLLGMDGVQEARSSKVSLEIVHLALKICPRYPVPVMVGRAPKDNKLITAEDVLAPIIRELNHEEIHVDVFVADKPCRCKALNMKQLGGTKYACESCYLPGTVKLFRDTKGAMRKRTCYLYRANARLRVHEESLAIMNNIDNLSEEAQKGFRGPAVLKDLNDFDFHRDLLPETMHLVYLGVQKRIIGLTIDVKVPKLKKHLLTYQGRINPNIFNSQHRSVKVPSDFNRRLRELDIVTYKAEEYRNYTLVYCFFFITQVAIRYPPLQVQIVFTFLVRGFMLPPDEFAELEEYIDMDQLLIKFQTMFARIFHPYFCTYNVHAFLHMRLILNKGPCTYSSAFPAESMFHHFILGLRPGTTSTSKQGMIRVFSRYGSPHHKCYKKIKYAPFVEEQTKDDSITYTADKKVWKVIAVDEVNSEVEVHEIITATYELFSSYGPNNKLNFSKVGVHKEVRIDTTRSQKLHMNRLQGKGVRICGLIALLPNHVLQESQ